MFKEMFEAKTLGECPFCHKEVYSNEFRNEISCREFEISGLCQNCRFEYFSCKHLFQTFQTPHPSFQLNQTYQS